MIYINLLGAKKSKWRGHGFVELYRALQLISVPESIFEKAGSDDHSYSSNCFKTHKCTLKEKMQSAMQSNALEEMGKQQ